MKVPIAMAKVNMAKTTYRLSPNEEAAIIKKERERRRKLRLQQVREQERAFAHKLRKQAKDKRDKELRLLAENLQEDWKEDQESKQIALETLYAESLKSVGDGHRAAEKENPQEKDEIKLAIAVQNEKRSNERHNRALKELQQQKREEFEKENSHILSRYELMKESSSMPVQVTSADGFSTTRFHMASGYVEKADAHEQWEVVSYQYLYHKVVGSVIPISVPQVGGSVIPISVPQVGGSVIPISVPQVGGSVIPISVPQKYSGDLTLALEPKVPGSDPDLDLTTGSEQLEKVFTPSGSPKKDFPIGIDGQLLSPKKDVEPAAEASKSDPKRDAWLPEKKPADMLVAEASVIPPMERLTEVQPVIDDKATGIDEPIISGSTTLLHPYEQATLIRSKQISELEKRQEEQQKLMEKQIEQKRLLEEQIEKDRIAQQELQDMLEKNRLRIIENRKTFSSGPSDVLQIRAEDEHRRLIHEHQQRLLQKQKQTKDGLAVAKDRLQRSRDSIMQKYPQVRLPTLQPYNTSAQFIQPQYLTRLPSQVPLPPQQHGMQAPPQQHGMQAPPQQHGMQVPPEQHGMQAPPQQHGMQVPPQQHGMHAPPQQHGMHAPLQQHGMQVPPQQHGMQVPPQQHGMQAPPQQHGMQVPPQQHGMQAPPQQHGMQVPPQQHGMQVPPQQHGMQAPPQQHGMQVPPQQHGMQAPPQQHGMQAPTLQHGMQAPTLQQRFSLQSLSPTMRESYNHPDQDSSYAKLVVSSRLEQVHSKRQEQLAKQKDFLEKQRESLLQQQVEQQRKMHERQKQIQEQVEKQKQELEQAQRYHEQNDAAKVSASKRLLRGPPPVQRHVPLSDSVHPHELSTIEEIESSRDDDDDSSHIEQQDHQSPKRNKEAYASVPSIAERSEEAYISVPSIAEKNKEAYASVPSIVERNKEAYASVPSFADDVGRGIMSYPSSGHAPYMGIDTVQPSGLVVKNDGHFMQTIWKPRASHEDSLSSGSFASDSITSGELEGRTDKVHLDFKSSAYGFSTYSREAKGEGGLVDPVYFQRSKVHSSDDSDSTFENSKFYDLPKSSGSTNKEEESQDNKSPTMSHLQSTMLKTLMSTNDSTSKSTISPSSLSYSRDIDRFQPLMQETLTDHSFSTVGYPSPKKSMSSLQSTKKDSKSPEERLIYSPSKRRFMFVPSTQADSLSEHSISTQNNLSFSPGKSGKRVTSLNRSDYSDSISSSKYSARATPEMLSLSSLSSFKWRDALKFGSSHSTPQTTKPLVEDDSRGLERSDDNEDFQSPVHSPSTPEHRDYTFGDFGSPHKTEKQVEAQSQVSQEKSLEGSSKSSAGIYIEKPTAVYEYISSEDDIELPRGRASQMSEIPLVSDASMSQYPLTETENESLLLHEGSMSSSDVKHSPLPNYMQIHSPLKSSIDTIEQMSQIENVKIVDDADTDTSIVPGLMRDASTDMSVNRYDRLIEESRSLREKHLNQEQEEKIRLEMLSQRYHQMKEALEHGNLAEKEETQEEYRESGILEEPDLTLLSIETSSSIGSIDDLQEESLDSFEQHEYQMKESPSSETRNMDTISEGTLTDNTVSEMRNMDTISEGTLTDNTVSEMRNMDTISEGTLTDNTVSETRNMDTISEGTLGDNTIDDGSSLLPLNIPGQQGGSMSLQEAFEKRKQDFINSSKRREIEAREKAVKHKKKITKAVKNPRDVRKKYEMVTEVGTTMDAQGTTKTVQFLGNTEVMTKPTKKKTPMVSMTIKTLDDRKKEEKEMKERNLRTVI
uniref:Centrosomal protein KIAA1731 homolog n=1 Tax=Saccoglossus kowalevskii TaxID=10224 RepID=A0ABM0GYD5_SACKO|nr:PREDICTED: centrosomal protein KIAA1731 homolog [Saccoglossus kowalevskii]